MAVVAAEGELICGRISFPDAVVGGARGRFLSGELLRGLALGFPEDALGPAEVFPPCAGCGEHSLFQGGHSLNDAAGGGGDEVGEVGDVLGGGGLGRDGG